MSSILKALKKVEDDKAVRRPDELKIDAEILRSDNTPRLTSTGIIVASLLLLAGGSCATYMFMKRDKVQEVMNSKSTVLPAQNQIAPKSPLSINAEQLPAAVAVIPANQQMTAKAESPRLQQPPLPVRTAPAVTALKPAKPVATLKPAEQAKIGGQTPPTSVVAKAVPELRVNGIAFQDGSAGSVAMINGVPVASGSVIDGVKIEEIFKNRVKFSYNGEKFEIPLGQSNRQDQINGQ